MMQPLRRASKLITAASGYVRRLERSFIGKHGSVDASQSATSIEIAAALAANDTMGGGPGGPIVSSTAGSSFHPNESLSGVHNIKHYSSGTSAQELNKSNSKNLLLQSSMVPIAKSPFNTDLHVPIGREDSSDHDSNSYSGRVKSFSSRKLSLSEEIPQGVAGKSDLEGFEGSGSGGGGGGHVIGTAAIVPHGYLPTHQRVSTRKGRGGREGRIPSKGNSSSAASSRSGASQSNCATVVPLNGTKRIGNLRGDVMHHQLGSGFVMKRRGFGKIFFTFF